MTSATTVGDATKISTPTYSWETVGANVNEGPAMLYYAGRTFLVYSASNCAGTGYALGRLELTGSSPLSAGSWTKYSAPIFTGANGNYEPGHNGFFNGPGRDIYIVFHASSTSPGARWHFYVTQCSLVSPAQETATAAGTRWCNPCIGTRTVRA